jgi:hypothetical protein
MEGKRRPLRRVLRRTHEVSRLEAELWTFVYEQLWPWTVPQADAMPRLVPARPQSPPQPSPIFARGA